MMPNTVFRFIAPDIREHCFILEGHARPCVENNAQLWGCFMDLRGGGGGGGGVSNLENYGLKENGWLDFIR